MKLVQAMDDLHIYMYNMLRLVIVKFIAVDGETRLVIRL